MRLFTSKFGLMNALMCLYELGFVISSAVQSLYDDIPVQGFYDNIQGHRRDLFTELKIECQFELLVYTLLSKVFV